MNLKLNHPDVRVLGVPGTEGDIRKITSQDLLREGKIESGELSLVVGCPPCQGYSLQGKRRVTDERNALYKEFVRLVGELRPRMTVFENVPGILNFQSGKIIADLQERVQSLGYATVTWILNASDLGIPQMRKRVFVIGTIGNHLPSMPPLENSTLGVWNAIRDLPSSKLCGDNFGCRMIPYRSPPSSTYASLLRGNKRKVGNCEIGNHSPGWLKRIHSLKWGERDESTWQSRLHPWKAAPTLTAGTRTRTACRPIHPFADRVLTVREGARLSSFPDWYAFPKEKAEAWSQIGNCVPPLMAQKILERVKNCI